MQESKVIFHIDEMDNWNMLIKDVIIGFTDENSGFPRVPQGLSRYSSQ